MKSPIVELQVHIKQLSEHVVACLPDFNDEIANKIRKATESAVKHYDFDAMIDTIVRNVLDEALNKAVRQHIKSINFVEILDIDGYIRRRVS